MTTPGTDERAVREAYALARSQLPGQQASVVLHLGGSRSLLAFGVDDAPLQVASWPLGLLELAHRLAPNGHLSEIAIEEAIVEVEDTVMPWRDRLPASACLFTADAVVVELATWAGMPEQTGQWRLSTDAVEHLFNRWVARAQGRPASQDDLPTTGAFSAALLVLRECLPHLGFEGITVLNTPAPDTTTVQAPIAPRRS